MSDKPDRDTEVFTQSPLLADTVRAAAAGPRVRVEVAARTHQGLVRDRNEDHHLAARLSRTLEALATNVPEDELPHLAELEGYIFAVADGLGGHTAGERASRLVIRNGLELILSSANWALKVNPQEAAKLVGRMRDYFIEIDRSLLRMMQSDPSLQGMATTLTVTYTVGLQAFVVHVGDSRVYRYHGGALEQMTRDHTVAQGMADAGAIDQGEVRRHAKRHVLTNVIAGRPGDVKPDVAAFPLHSGDTLLLCSDGLHAQVPERVIAEVLAQPLTAADACDRLVALALQHGGRDNITAVLARYHDPNLPLARG